MKDILLWDQRFPEREPQRLSINDSLASAMVRSGAAAPVNSADYAALNVGGALSAATPTEIVVEDGFSKRMRRVIVPVSVAAIAVSLGVGARVPGHVPIGGDPTPTPTPTPAPFTSVAADGWYGLWETTPSLSTPQSFTVSRQGYNSSGSLVTFDETRYGTFWLRQPYPNQASKSTDNRVAFDDPLYSSDTVAGKTNNSTEASPKPTANWLMEDRIVVGDSLEWRMVAFHRNGVACVEVTASDGTTSVTQRVSTVSSFTLGNGIYMCVYSGTLDISTLANGDSARIQLDAVVKPRVGTSASIRSTADETDPYRFSPRYFLRNTAQLAAPRVVYVSTVSGTTGGIVSTDDAAAYAAPCDSWQTARSKAIAAYGQIDGVIFYLKADSTTYGTTGSTTANCVAAGIVLAKDPRTSGLQPWAFGGFTPRIGSPSGISGGGAISVRGFAITRSANSFSGVTATAGTRAVFHFSDCTFDNGAVASATATQADLFFRNVTFSNVGSSTLISNTAVSYSFIGCSGSLGLLTDGTLMVGCNWTSTGTLGITSSKYVNGAMVMFNRFASCPVNLVGGLINNNPDSSPCSGVIIAQNEVVGLANSADTMFRISGDRDVVNTYNTVFVNNTVPGADDINRNNMFYDENGTTPRTHKIILHANNLIMSRLATKGDIFMSDGTRQGNWQYANGCGVRSNLVCSRTAFLHDYDGRNSVVTENSGEAGMINPLFVDNRGPTGAAAGTTGGNYRLQSGSPAIGLAIDEFFPVDLDGNPRNRGAVGCYA